MGSEQGNLIDRQMQMGDLALVIEEAMLEWAMRAVELDVGVVVGEVEIAACAFAFHPLFFFPFFPLTPDPSFALGGHGQSTTQ